MAIFPNTVPQPQNCGSISNQGSFILVAELKDCASEPTVITLTPAVAAIGDESVDVTHSSTESFYLRKGGILHFGANKAVVTAETLVAATGTTTVPVEPLTAAIAVTDLAETWAMQRIIAPQTLPINEESSTTDITDLSNGLQGSEAVAKLMLNPAVQIISRKDDRAYHQIIAKNASVGGVVYVAFALSDESHVFGRAVVSGNSKEFTQSDVNKPTFNLLMQAPYYSYTMFRYESTVNQTLINRARKLCGLDELSA